MRKTTEKERRVFIRTVTNFYAGRVVNEDATTYTLDQAAWIADTKRFSDSMATGEFEEVEPYPAAMRVTIFKGACVDCCEWTLPLPRVQR